MKFDRSVDQCFLNLAVNKRVILFFYFLISTVGIAGDCSLTTGMCLKSLCNIFAKGLIELDFGRFEYSHEENLKKIPDKHKLLRRQAFLKKIKRELLAVRHKMNDESERVEAGKLLYEINFNLRLNNLQQKTCGSTIDKFLHGKDGLASHSHGKEWYLLYLLRHTSLLLEPEDMMKYGIAELKRIKGEIEVLAKQMGYQNFEGYIFAKYLNDPKFNVEKSDELEELFRHTQSVVMKNMSKIFYATEPIAVQIMQAPGSNRNAPPGYYFDGVFYYNHSSKQFNRRMVEWIYLHEVMPGHHYQITVDKSRTKKNLDPDVFWYPGFAEGWAVYCENLGSELGCYEDPYSFLGKLEWDMVRAARLVIDTGIHFYGWKKYEATDWWLTSMPFALADMADREVDRVLKWPAQAYSYKIGEKTILELKGQMQRSKKDSFCIKEFHSLVLKNGGLPLNVLCNEVFKSCLNKSAGS